MRQIILSGVPQVPAKIICIGRNYLEHIQELKSEIPEEPVIFMKPNSAISNTVFAGHEEAIHYEAEMCFLVKNGQFTAVGFGLDLTKRELQRKLKSKGLPWERCKAFRDSAVFSEFKPLANGVDALELHFSINGELVQRATTDMMLHHPNVLLESITGFLDLDDGDIVMTGTPSGVGPLMSGMNLNGAIYDSGALLVSEDWTVV